MRGIKYVAIFILGFGVFFGLIFAFQKSNTDLPIIPDFSLTTFEGKKITLSQLKDKPVVVNIWASWCGPCREEASDLEKFWQEYKGEIYMIGLNYADKRDDALAFIKEFKITYPNGPDENKIAVEKFKITGIPETFIIKDGRIQEHIVGIATLESLSRKIEGVL